MTIERVLSAEQSWHVECGDALEVLRGMPDGCAQTCVTSPPYWGLRSYDENAMRIDPNLSPEIRTWLEMELARRGVNACR